MAMKTRFGLEGYGVRRAGSFAGKPPAASHPHPVGRLTRLGMEGYGVRRAIGIILVITMISSRYGGAPIGSSAANSAADGPGMAVYSRDCCIDIVQPY